MKLPQDVILMTPTGPRTISLDGTPIDGEWSRVRLGQAKAPMALRLSCDGEGTERDQASLAAYLNMPRQPVILERVPGRLDEYRTSSEPRRIVNPRIIAIVEKLLGPVLLWYRLDEGEPLIADDRADSSYVLVGERLGHEGAERPVAIVACLAHSAEDPPCS